MVCFRRIDILDGAPSTLRRALRSAGTRREDRGGTHVATREGELQGRRRAQRRDARRRLLDAAHGLLEQRGWTDISLEDIAEAAQVARTAFYRPFEGRQQLVTWH